MVAEEHDAIAIVYRRVFADEMLVEDRRHGRDVLVTEAQVGARESGISGLYGRDSDLSVGSDHVAREDLFRDRRRAVLGVDFRNGNFALHARDVERKEAAVLDHLARDLVFPASENFERYLFAAAYAIVQSEVC